MNNLIKATEAFAKAVEPLSSEAAELLEKLAGPACKELGLLLQENVRLARFRNTVRILDQVREIIAKADISPQAVPLRTLVPLLEHASLEDDPDMQLKWASLLANASTDLSETTQYPAFPAILSQLSPKEAKMLDALYELETQMEGQGVKQRRQGILRSAFLTSLKLSEVQYESIAQNLIRLGLCHGRGMTLNFIDNKDSVFLLRDTSVLAMTPLGIQFVKACRPPTRQET